MDDRRSLLAGKGADPAPETVVGRLVGSDTRLASRRHPVQVDARRSTRVASHDVDGLAMGDGVQPGTQVLPVTEPRIGAQRRDERVLQAILGQVRTDGRGQEPMQLRGMRVHQHLEGWQAHVG